MKWHHPLRPLVWALWLAAERARSILNPGPLDAALAPKTLPTPEPTR